MTASALYNYSYEAAIARIEAVAAAETVPAINPICRSYARTHGKRTERCVLLIHGYTNCPQQWRAFAELLYERGHSVYVPRLPHHGLADRLTTELAKLSGEALVTWLERSIELAAGLGEQVDVMGLSAGGNLAAFAAQYRRDINRAVVIAPVLGTPRIAGWATPALANVARIAPNRFRWWDPALRDRRRGVEHAYPRFATRSLGEIVALGLEVLGESGARSPGTRNIVVVTNACDEAVTNQPVDRMVANWRSHGANVRAHCFPAELGLIHDIIDPDQQKQRVDYVYPILLELIEA